jgi:hypothetical protein
MFEMKVRGWSAAHRALAGFWPASIRCATTTPLLASASLARRLIVHAPRTNQQPL